MSRASRPLVLLASVTAVAAGLGSIALGPTGQAGAAPLAPVVREAQPVVLTGAQIPAWSQLAAQGTALPWPSGALDGVRDAHNGTLVVPPDARVGVPTDDIAAYSWRIGRGFVEVPVQVDQRFPYFLANANSDFAIYSATDEELTYQWDTESWLKTAGTCVAEYPAGVGPSADPVPGLDDDDEIVFMSSDAGSKAPTGARYPGGGTGGMEVAVSDPLEPLRTRYVYLVRRPGGSTFDAGNGYVRYQRHADADEWIDRASFTSGHPEGLGTSNTGYGPNLSGTVCDPDGTVRNSNDRFVRDGVTVSTPKYEFRASGRWMLRDMRVAKPGAPWTYGPDLVDRWKGRAFTQGPDESDIIGGFEDEQANWEANSVLLGERMGPVRALRETWGADSGTNVTKTDIFYRDSIAYRYRLRVHPIPPDGLYALWDYNAGVAERYFSSASPTGAPIDGAPDANVAPVNAIASWEQVAGAGDAGSLVYTTEVLSPTSLVNGLAVGFHRDDACYDDGTGDDPVARPYPGEASTDQRVQDAYAALAEKPYAELACSEKQGSWGSHGVHFLAAPESDNLFQPKPATEVDAVQWQFAVPTAQPERVGGDRYARSVVVKQTTTVSPRR